MKDISEFFDTETFKWILLDKEQSQYLISSKGHVYATNKFGKTHIFSMLKENIQDNGYHTVILYSKGKTFPCSIHVLVALYFIPNPHEFPVVNHKDGNKNNNDYTNLEWTTPKENSIHAANNHLLPTGEKSRLARISNKTARKICEEFEKNELFIDEIVKKYFTTYNTVYDIFRRKSWKQLSKDYDFSKYNKDKRYK